LLRAVSTLDVDVVVLRDEIRCGVEFVRCLKSATRLTKEVVPHVLP
jgi:hypothetical protein